MFSPKYRTSFAHQYIIEQYKGIKNIEKHAVVGTPHIKEILIANYYWTWKFDYCYKLIITKYNKVYVGILNIYKIKNNWLIKLSFK